MTDLAATAVIAATISAEDIADALGRPRPTRQQRAVIESGLEPALVVAGAGSGKTETMAARVLWLLANGRVAASEILGLTFTRKAAGELSQRIRERIAELDRVGLLDGTEMLDGTKILDRAEFEPPVVATYNSFANRIYRDNAMLLGREGDGAVLGEASAWQLARSIVVASDDQRLAGLDKSVDAVTRAVLGLSRGMAENLAESAAVARFAEQFAETASLPAGGSGAYQAVADTAAVVGALPVLLELADRYREEKARRGLVEYSDQVALALELVRTAPGVADGLRDQHRVVLLDEYQDTSTVQTRLLAELFGGRSVMAVGDPNQSIYGWRGASADNLGGFAEQFGSAGQFRGVSRYALTTSWRNGTEVLAVANTLVQPLHNRVGVQRLEPAPTASRRPVEVVIEETLPEEAEAVASWLERELKRPGSRPPTAAVLFRARATQGAFIDALRRRGIPFHVLGVGGLMAEPEIADLVSALSVISDPTAGSELVRLLAGSRWRVGAKDLQALGRLSSWLLGHDYAQRPIDDDTRQRMRESVAEAETGSIVDALDFVVTAREGHSALAGFSAVGLERLRDAGAVLARLRSRAGLGLAELIGQVEQELLLDIEVAANETRPLGDANREAFLDALSGYLAVDSSRGDSSASLRGFLSWLREAQWRDGLAPRPEDPEPGTVQLLTIHGAKGLEWDLVAVPRMVEQESPSVPQEGYTGWLRFGALPWEFRCDAAELPLLAWRQASTRKELIEAQKLFKAEVKAAHEREERRLAYVAVTRARHALLLCGSFWSTQSSARGPSPFLRELAESGAVPALPAMSEHDQNPLGDRVNRFSWPLDPLGGRRAAVERAAEMVRGARPGSGGHWEAELDLLLHERSERMRGAQVVELPARVAASRFAEVVLAPADAASALRRPMPQRPYRATRLGTLFHSWVEERYGIAGSLPELPQDWDDADDEQTLAGLQRNFEASEFAALVPEAVELELHLPFGEETVVCKLDAVYALEGGHLIVDWKTGRSPRDAAELASKQLQLALYRQAFADWKGVAPETVAAAFYYVAEDLVIRPESLQSKPELLELWRQVTGDRLGAPARVEHRHDLVHPHDRHRVVDE
ncbi:ATP-dependent DNA helicase [soil metagenome]